MEFKDYYKVLGVEKSAASDEIKKKYRKLAKKYHPDANSGNLSGEEKFKEVSEAYDVLGDKDKRAKYDQMYDDVKSGRYNASGGFDPSGYSAWAGQNGRGYTTYTWTGGDDQDGGFSDFFNMFFGGGLGRNVYEDLFGQAAAGGRTYSQNQAGYSARGQDITASVEIGIKKALRGGKETVILKFNSGEKKVKFNIPAGIQSGGVIKLTGLGNPGVGGGKNGDLLLEIILKPEAGFAVNGLDLEKQLEIYPWQAALGDEITVNTLEEKLNIKIPAGIQNGGKLRVAGRGYRDKSGRRGAITFIMKIVNPSQMSDEMRGLYEKLARQAKAEEKTAR